MKYLDKYTLYNPYEQKCLKLKLYHGILDDQLRRKEVLYLEDVVAEEYHLLGLEPTYIQAHKWNVTKLNKN